jgi:hypothetical protein
MGELSCCAAHRAADLAEMGPGGLIFWKFSLSVILLFPGENILIGRWEVFKKSGKIPSRER